MYRVTSLTCSFVYGLGLQQAGIIHNNLAAYAHHFLFFHVRSANQPKKTGVKHCHKMVGRPWFSETRVIWYQPFVSDHNERLHSECHTIDKGVKITSFSLPIYSTLKFTYVTAYDRRPHSETEWNKHEVTNCNQLQYAEYNTTSKTRYNNYLIYINLTAYNDALQTHRLRLSFTEIPQRILRGTVKLQRHERLRRP